VVEATVEEAAIEEEIAADVVLAEEEEPGIRNNPTRDKI
jgi:hypothetical protein